jgi:hypothetical protein
VRQQQALSSVFTGGSPMLESMMLTASSLVIGVSGHSIVPKMPQPS